MSDGWPRPIAPEPKPISDALEQHLKEVLTQIPSGRRGQLTAAVTTSGVELGLGAKATVKHVDIAGSGWAAKEWGGRGWSAGARAAFTW